MSEVSLYRVFIRDFSPGARAAASDQGFYRGEYFWRIRFPNEITKHVSLPVTSQSNCAAIFFANRIGDPRNRVCQKYSPRLDPRPHAWSMYAAPVFFCHVQHL